MASGNRLTCPDCKLDLPSVESGSVVAHRCARCRGIWLDPASFRRLCEEEESRPVDEDTALVAARPAPARRPGPPPDSQVRYRPCPACGEVMNRSNFGRVSGVVIDVCRPHGAWFDRGELAAIRRFLRGGGLKRYDRLRRVEDELRRRPEGTSAPLRRDGSLDDLYGVLAGGDGWDVPSRIPRLLVVALSTALGGWFLWTAFHPRPYGTRTLGAGPVLLGVTCLYFAWRALEQWAARRRR